MSTSNEHLTSSSINNLIYPANDEYWTTIRPISPSTISSLSSELTNSEDLPVSNQQQTLSLVNPTPILPSIVPILSTIPPTINPTISLTNIMSQQSMSLLNDMPLRTSKLAPATFRGKYSDVTRFIKQYNRLLEQHKIVSDADKCEGILEYCSHKVGDFIEACRHFHTPNWRLLQAEILKYYDAEREDSKYRPNDLIAFIKQSAIQSMHNLSHWKKYYREYLARAGFLMSKGRISSVDYDGYFWYGIPSHIRTIFEEKLYARHPNHDLSDPWPIEYVGHIADLHFKRDKFSEKLVHLPALGIEMESDYDSDESDLDSDSDDSEYEYERRVRKKRSSKKRKYKHKERKLRLTRPVLEEEPMRKIHPPPEEIEGIIEQLNTMSINDPKYGQLYFKAVSNDKTGIAAKCIRRSPVQEAGNKRPEPSQRLNTIPTSIVYPNNNMPRQTVNNQLPYRRPNHCYGCFDSDHTLRDCPEIAKLINKGVIKFDPQTRKYHLKDGQPLIRQSDESLKNTILRIAPQTSGNKVNFATLSKEVANFYTRYTDNEDQWPESEDDHDDGPYWKTAHPAYAIEAQPESEDEEAIEVYPAERTFKSTTQARKDINREPIKSKLEDAYMPARKTRSSGPAPPIPTENSNKRQPVPKRYIPTPSAIKEVPAVHEPIPVDARKPRNQETQDIVMNEPGISRTQKDSKVDKLPVSKISNRPTDESNQNATGPRQSELSSKTEPKNIVQGILNTEISLPLRDLLGASKELSASLQEVIKFKNQAKPLATHIATQDVYINAFTRIPKNDEPLIKLNMKCDSNPVTAVIDTGSQLNVVSKEFAARCIGLPIDYNQGLQMNDVNGGSGYLEGLIEDVSLTCGGVTTHANIYVGNKVPFDLLLGRPWQRGNYVTIDERTEGTFLVFKDSKSVKPRYEVKVRLPESMLSRAHKLSQEINMITIGKPTSENEANNIPVFQEFLENNPDLSDQVKEKLVITSHNPKWLSRTIDPLSKRITKTGEISSTRYFDIRKEEISRSLNEHLEHEYFPIRSRILDSRNSSSGYIDNMRDNSIYRAYPRYHNPNLEIESDDEVNVRMIDILGVHKSINSNNPNQYSPPQIVEIPETDSYLRDPPSDKVALDSTSVQNPTPMSTRTPSPPLPSFAEASIAHTHARRILESVPNFTTEFHPTTLVAERSFLVGVGRAERSEFGFSEFAMPNVTLALAVEGQIHTIQGDAYLQLSYPHADQRPWHLFQALQSSPSSNENLRHDSGNCITNADVIKLNNPTCPNSASSSSPFLSPPPTVVYEDPPVGLVTPGAFTSALSSTRSTPHDQNFDVKRLYHIPSSHSQLRPPLPTRLSQTIEPDLRCTLTRRNAGNFEPCVEESSQGAADYGTSAIKFRRLSSTSTRPTGDNIDVDVDFEQHEHAPQPIVTTDDDASPSRDAIYGFDSNGCYHSPHAIAICDEAPPESQHRPYVANPIVNFAAIAGPLPAHAVTSRFLSPLTSYTPSPSLSVMELPPPETFDQREEAIPMLVTAIDAVNRQAQDQYPVRPYKTQPNAAYGTPTPSPPLRILPGHFQRSATRTNPGYILAYAPFEPLNTGYPTNLVLPHEYRVFLHYTFDHDPFETFAYGGGLTNEIQMHTFGSIPTDSFISLMRPSDVEFISSIVVQTQQGHFVDEGILVPNHCLLPPRWNVYPSITGEPIYRFPRVETLLQIAILLICEPYSRQSELLCYLYPRLRNLSSLGSSSDGWSDHGNDSDMELEYPPIDADWENLSIASSVTLESDEESLSSLEILRPKTAPPELERSP